MTRLLFYDDSASSGGHEIMTMGFIRRLVRMRHLSLTFIYHAGNSALQTELERVREEGGNLEIRPVPYRYKPLHGMIPLLAANNIIRISRMIRRENPEIVVVVQGSIEISSVGLMASRVAGCRTVSYIPLAQTKKAMNASLAAPRDFANRLYYALPDRFITISRFQGELLRGHGIPPGKVVVVPNFIDPAHFRKIEKRVARSMLGLDENIFLFVTVGRVVFKQKGQNILIRAVGKLGVTHREAGFLIVGNGPDIDQAEALIRDLRLSGMVRTLPWQASPDVVYSAADAVILPSMFEGVPLVMIEALHYKLPVIASRIGGYSEFLPGEWLFPPGDEMALAARIREFLLEEQAPRVNTVHKEFQKTFHRDTAHLEFLKSVTDGWS